MEESWLEVLHEFSKFFDQALETEAGVLANNAKFIVNRHGFWEETYFCFAVIPIPGDYGSTSLLVY